MRLIGKVVPVEVIVKALLDVMVNLPDAYAIVHVAAVGALSIALALIAALTAVLKAATKVEVV